MREAWILRAQMMMMTKKGFHMLKKITWVGIVWLVLVQGAQAVEGRDAEKFMSEIGDRVIQILTDRTFSQQDRKTEFRNILETKFNLKAIGKFVLGRYWKQATQEEKDIFLNLFKETTIATYASRFQDYTSEKFSILGSRPEEDGGITVLTQITRPDGQNISINWKLFEKNGEIRIYDVSLEGISMGITQRSEFATVIQKGGGQGISPLIKALMTKVDSLTKTK